MGSFNSRLSIYNRSWSGKQVQPSGCPVRAVQLMQFQLTVFSVCISPRAVVACIPHLLIWMPSQVNSVVLACQRGDRKEHILLVHRMSLRGTVSGGKIRFDAVLRDLIPLSSPSSATFPVSLSPCVTLTPVNNPNLSLSPLTKHIWGFFCVFFLTSTHPVATFRCFYLSHSVFHKQT